jgi:hypothetical protein
MQAHTYKVAGIVRAGSAGLVGIHWSLQQRSLSHKGPPSQSDHRRTMIDCWKVVGKSKRDESRLQVGPVMSFATLSQPRCGRRRARLRLKMRDVHALRGPRGRDERIGAADDETSGSRARGVYRVDWMGSWGSGPLDADNETWALLAYEQS